MRLSKLALAGLTAGTLSLGGAGVAFATTSGGTGTTTPSAPSTTTTTCPAKASVRLARLERRDTNLKARVSRDQAAEAKATANGHPKRASALATRIGALEARDDRVEARIATIEARCPGITPATGSPATGSPTTTSAPSAS